MVDVNVKGVFNTCLPAMARMKARGKGQIAIMSSVAGIMPVPTIAEYSATKFAVEVWKEVSQFILGALFQIHATDLFFFLVVRFRALVKLYVHIWPHMV